MAELNLDSFHCLLINLIRNAVLGKATSIAIRIKETCHRIQIIDNAFGFPYTILRQIGESGPSKLFLNCSNNKDRYYYLCDQNFRSIVQNVATTLSIATKYDFNGCYEKVLKKQLSSKTKKISNRPTYGTTLSIYFLEHLWKTKFNLSIFVNSIYHMMKSHPQVSLTLCDDDAKQMIYGIRKKHNQQLKKKNYFLKSRNSYNFPFITYFNNRVFKNAATSDTESSVKYAFCPASKVHELSIGNVQKNIVVQDAERTNGKQGKNVEEMDFDGNVIPSQWSDWSVKCLNDTSNENVMQSNNHALTNLNKSRRYRFLPVNLTNLLPVNINKKLVNRRIAREFNSCGVFDNLPRRQDFDVRPCNKKNKLKQLEIILKRDSLKDIEVLNQVNSEFIAATVLQNDRKLLILIDQHAMHERIRYENLLQDYKYNENQLRLVKLERPMKIEDIPTNIYERIMKNHNLFTNFGLELTYELASNRTIIVRTIPKCFWRKKHKLEILSSVVRKLLMELIDKLISGVGFNSLPSVIHNAIASEACHGAIKFGDLLNLDQCNVMIDYWKRTNLPNRCAHGRPVIIPLLSINRL